MNSPAVLVPYEIYRISGEEKGDIIAKDAETHLLILHRFYFYAYFVKHLFQPHDKSLSPL